MIAFNGFPSLLISILYLITFPSPSGLLVRLRTFMRMRLQILYHNPDQAVVISPSEMCEHAPPHVGV